MRTISHPQIDRTGIAGDGIRRALRGGIALAVMASMGGGFNALSATDTSGPQPNPFVTGNVDAGPTEATAREIALTRDTARYQGKAPARRTALDRPTVPDWRPTATATLQVPTVRAAASKTVSTFVGPDWERYETAGIESPTSVVEFSPDFVPSVRSQAGPIAVHPMAQQVAMTDRPSRLPSIAAELPSPTLRTQAQLVKAARQRAEYLSQVPPEPRAGASVYLATQTAQSQLDIAAKLFQQAQLDYDYQAYASAETSAWQSLEKSVQAIDLASKASPWASGVAPVEGLEMLHRGKRAILEACDFVGPFAQNDEASIARLARAHETPVVRESLPPMRPNYAMPVSIQGQRPGSIQGQRPGSIQGQRRSSDGSFGGSLSQTELPSASEAIDRYLDYARSQFAELAARSLLAAQTMDLLAAIRLGRNELDQLPGPTAICLRRAAVQGQSKNADLVGKLGHHLADVGLIDEAKWALGHSLSLQPNPANAARLRQLHSISTQSVTSQYGQSILAATQANPSVNRVPEVIALSPMQFASISTSVLPGPQSNASGFADRAASASNDYSPESTSQNLNSQASHSRPSSGQANEPMHMRTASRYTGPPVIPASSRQPSSRQAVHQTPDGFESNATEYAEAQNGRNPPATKTSSFRLPGLKRWW